MIRTNLSTRPFYNERAVHMWLLVAGRRSSSPATVFNVVARLRYSRSDTRARDAGVARRSARRRAARSRPRSCAPASTRGRSTLRRPTRARPTI